MPPRPRQLQLFSTTGWFAARLGADFFDEVPNSPGVYFFYGEADRLLYIGQSKNLKKRMGSYRFVNAERHSRRIARMVNRIQRAEWKVCDTDLAAILLEKELLLEHKPPFNRAGVWIPPPWWLVMECEQGLLRASLKRETAEDAAAGIGPLVSGFRHSFAALMRLTHRWMHPQCPLWDYPLGLLREIPPLTVQLTLKAEFSFALEHLKAIVLGEKSHLPEVWELDIAAMDDSAQKEFWLEQLRVVNVWRVKQSSR